MNSAATADAHRKAKGKSQLGHVQFPSRNTGESGYTVMMEGRLELPHYLQEQAVSVNYTFGGYKLRFLNGRGRPPCLPCSRQGPAPTPNFPFFESAIYAASKHIIFKAPPPFEKLVGDLAGAYSRRLNIQHRTVYPVIAEEKSRKGHSDVATRRLKCQDFRGPWKRIRGNLPSQAEPLAIR
jgi:hypothetical protein